MENGTCERHGKIRKISLEKRKKKTTQKTERQEQ